MKNEREYLSYHRVKFRNGSQSIFTSAQYHMLYEHLGTRAKGLANDGNWRQLGGIVDSILELLDADFLLGYELTPEELASIRKES